MSDIDVPAGQTGGPSDVSELPSKLRVHALAKLISATSRQVLDTLATLGEPAKGAQSSIDRETAVRVIEALASGDHDLTAVAAAEVADDESRPRSSPEAAGAAKAESAPSVPESPAAPAVALSDAPAPSSASFGAAVWGNSDRADTPELEPESPYGALPLFAAPSPMFLPPEPVSRPARRGPEPEAAEEADTSDGAEEGSDDASDDGGESKRRRRRGRRGRGRGRGSDDDPAGSEGGTADDESTSDDESDEPASSTDRGDKDESEADDSADDQGDSDDEGSGGSRRRRRRRRRKDSSEGDSSDSDDPPNTVTKVRDSRPGGGEDVNQGIQAVRGSTRLEAKRQRRRDGRDAGRRRAPVISEAEFLARRESVERTMIVRQHGERSEIGVLEDGVLVEHFVTSSGGSSLVGNVYLGRVQNVLPSMEAAFVDIGRGRNAVLYAGEVDWDAAGLAGKARRIEQALSSGDNILVQVTKDPVGHKGARLTTQISLPGRFLVYVPSGGTHGISRKLPDIERRRLKDLLREIVPDDAGVIIRTASEGVSQEALERDVRRLQAQWDVVKTKADAAKGSSGKSKAPELLYEEPDLMIKVVRDQFNEDFTKLVVSGDDAWDTLHAYISHVAPELLERLNRHVGTTDVFTDFRVDEQLAKALDRKVWLPSGGTLVIDRTEAMTVIDVNTGKFTGSGGNLEETVTRNNLEAAEEIVRQLRLRDVGGIIVVDFIDMVLESNRDLVLRRLTECLGRDRTRHQVAEVTSLGLVQMTRKRVGVGLLEAFSTPCEHCRGRGVVVSSDPVEHKHDPGQSQPSGRRRGRGGERGDRSDQGGSHNGGNGGSGGNGHAGGNGSGGNGGGRRRGGDDSHGSGTQKAAESGSSNGRSVPHSPKVPSDHVPVASPAEIPAKVPAEVTEAGTEVQAAPRADKRDPAPFAAPVAVTPSALESSAADPARTAALTETRPDELTAQVPAPAEPSEPSGQSSAEVKPSRPERTPQPAAPEPQPVRQAAPESVQPPAPESVQPPAPAPRRRRRAASRPAGPPGGA